MLRRQAIIWTNAGILLIRNLGTHFSEILSELHTFSFKKIDLKMSSTRWWPFCLGLNVLKLEGICIIFMMKISICQHKLHRFLSLCPHCQERRGHIYAQWRPGCWDRYHISDLCVDGVIYANITNNFCTWYQRPLILHQPCVIKISYQMSWDWKWDPCKMNLNLYNSLYYKKRFLIKNELKLILFSII